MAGRVTMPRLEGSSSAQLSFPDNHWEGMNSVKIICNLKHLKGISRNPPPHQYQPTRRNVKFFVSTGTLWGHVRCCPVRFPEQVSGFFNEV